MCIVCKALFQSKQKRFWKTPKTDHLLFVHDLRQETKKIYVCCPFFAGTKGFQFLWILVSKKGQELILNVVELK